MQYGASLTRVGYGILPLARAARCCVVWRRCDEVIRSRAVVFFGLEFRSVALLFLFQNLERHVRVVGGEGEFRGAQEFGWVVDRLLMESLTERKYSSFASMPQCYIAGLLGRSGRLL